MATIYDTFLGNLGMSEEQLEEVQGKVLPYLSRSGHQTTHQGKELGSGRRTVDGIVGLPGVQGRDVQMVEEVRSGGLRGA
jgi:hypothetical protein